MHLPSLKGHPHAQISAICGRDRARADEMARKYQIPQVFSDYRAMIEQGDLQALIVSVPDDLHYAITLDALAAGLHVLCEKPLASTAEQAREMYEKAETAGVKHMVLFTYRWLPQYQYLHELAAQGFLGRCYQADLHFRMDYSRGGTYSWRFDRRRANGVLGDLGSHMIDLARWCVGDIARVNAHLTTFVDRPGADGQPLDPANDSAVLMLEFANGAHGTIQLSALARGLRHDWQHQIALFGELGALEATADTRNEIYSARSSEAQMQPLPIPDQYWGNVERGKIWDVLFNNSAGVRLFIDAIIEGHQLEPTFYDGLKTQEVVDAAIESHRSGRWVTVGAEMRRSEKRHRQFAEYPSSGGCDARRVHGESLTL